MENRYKLLLSNRTFYKEVELLPKTTQLRVGTEIDCDVRLHKKMFFEKVELTFEKKQEQWSVVCCDNLYLSVGDVRKLITKQLSHGDELTLKYQESDHDVFTLSFVIDFDNGEKRYERCIDISSTTQLLIGTDATAHMVLSSPYAQREKVQLITCEEGYRLHVKESTYGVYHNGTKVMTDVLMKNYDFFSLADYVFYVRDRMIWAEIRPDLQVNALRYTDYPNQNDYPKFNRNTRVKTTVCDDKIDLLDPPALPKKQKTNLLVKLLPSIGMLVAAATMAMFGNPLMLVFSGISAVMSVVMGIINIKQGDKVYEQNCKDRIEKYKNYIAAKRAEIESLRAMEAATLQEIYLPFETVVHRLDTFSTDLFDRTRNDEDFLCVRLGSGKIESVQIVNYKKQERLEIEDELQQMPEKIYHEYRFLEQAPIVCDLKSVNAVGVVGKTEDRFSIFKTMVIDLVARHYFSDVNIVFVAEKEHSNSIDWLRMLPHAYNTQIGFRSVVVEDERKNIVFEHLYKELTDRMQSKRTHYHLVVFFYDEYGFKSHPISKFVDHAKDLGVTFLFFGNSLADIPQGCGYIIRLQNAQHGELVSSEDKNSTQAFTYQSMDNQRAQMLVSKLAPVHTEEISLEGTLTKQYALFDMLGIMAVEDLSLAQRWGTSNVCRSMAAPIGISKTGVVALDLHDKAHGPHGLVAGTTGSGKSEILQTYILSMATLYHPYEVAFVVIDFKGGGMVNQFKELPHLLGAITNIDGKAINRSLKSMKAELQKRQRLFAESEVNHIDSYIKKYQSGVVKQALPHLIIIVDEFAELKAEQPEFMKELISAARIGRSLGVHLILATQKPSGQVNEQIWSNSRFKLCLKVQSQEDSNEILKSPLAAEIKEPGRAYLQVGNNEIFELFQSAYSGASEKTDESNVRAFTLYELSASGKRTPVYQQKKNTSESNQTQLEVVVKYVQSHCTLHHIQRLSDICLPSLQPQIDFMQQEVISSVGCYAQVGVYDDPDKQYQGTYTIDCSNANTMILGSAQAGKTNLLQTMIRSLSTNYTPKEVTIYIIDFASMVLKNFETLQHVGGVVGPSEDEKLKNLFKLLNTEVKQRKEKLMTMGISSFVAYREAGKTDLPQIVLLIDNLTALKELYFQEDDTLLSLCREGLSVGISVVIANAQTTGIGYKYLSNFSTRIALYCNDTSEYSTLFSHCRERVENIAGRCLVEMENRHLDCQVYLAFKGEIEIDRVQEIQAYIASTNERNPRLYATKIPMIPPSLTEDYMRVQFAHRMKSRFSLVMGLDYDAVLPVSLNFASLGTLAISGRAQSGKHNWIYYAVHMLQKAYPNQTKLYVVDGINRKLSALGQTSEDVHYSFLAEDAVACVKEMEGILQQRYEALLARDETVLDTSELLLLILNNQDAVTAICNNAEALNAYKNVVGRYKNLNVCILLADVDNVNIPYSAPEMFKNIREQRQVLFFDDIANLKLFDVPLAVVRNFKKPIELGDCYYIKDRAYTKIKTAKAALYKG